MVIKDLSSTYDGDNECKQSYLRNINKFADDISPLLGRGLTEHHTLHPLRKSVKERNGALKLGLILQRGWHSIIFVVGKLHKTGDISYTLDEAYWRVQYNGSSDYEMWPRKLEKGGGGGGGGGGEIEGGGEFN